MKKNTNKKFNDNMQKVFQIIEQRFNNYNWLITDFECNYLPDKVFHLEQVMLTGKELVTIIKNNHDLQFYWGVFSGFDLHIPAQTIRSDDFFPYADGNSEIFNKDRNPQHPLAVIEIVAFDGDQVSISSKDEEIIKYFE